VASPYVGDFSPRLYTVSGKPPPAQGRGGYYNNVKNSRSKEGFFLEKCWLAENGLFIGYSARGCGYRSRGAVFRHERTPGISGYRQQKGPNDRVSPHLTRFYSCIKYRWEGNNEQMGRWTSGRGLRINTSADCGGQLIQLWVRSTVQDVS